MQVFFNNDTYTNEQKKMKEALHQKCFLLFMHSDGENHHKGQNHGCQRRADPYSRIAVGQDLHDGKHRCQNGNNAEQSNDVHNSVASLLLLLLLAFDQDVQLIFHLVDRLVDVVDLQQIGIHLLHIVPTGELRNIYGAIRLEFKHKLLCLLGLLFI